MAGSFDEPTSPALLKPLERGDALEARHPDLLEIAEKISVRLKRLRPRILVISTADGDSLQERLRSQTYDFVGVNSVPSGVTGLDLISHLREYEAILLQWPPPEPNDDYVLRVAAEACGKPVVRFPGLDSRDFSTLLESSDTEWIANLRSVLAPCPFPGIQPFTEHQSRYYFTTSVLGYALKQIDRKGLCIIGDNQCGKTSFVWAGLTPELRRRGRVVVHAERFVEELAGDGSLFLDEPEDRQPYGIRETVRRVYGLSVEDLVLVLDGDSLNEHLKTMTDAGIRVLFTSETEPDFIGTFLPRIRLFEPTLDELIGILSLQSEAAGVSLEGAPELRELFKDVKESRLSLAADVMESLFEECREKGEITGEDISRVTAEIGFRVPESEVWSKPIVLMSGPITARWGGTVKLVADQLDQFQTIGAVAAREEELLDCEVYIAPVSSESSLSENFQSEDALIRSRLQRGERLLHLQVALDEVGLKISDSKSVLDATSVESAADLAGLITDRIESWQLHAEQKDLVHGTRAAVQDQKGEDDPPAEELEPFKDFRVMVVGSPKPSNLVTKLCAVLGNRLKRDGYKMVSWDQPGVQHLVADSFAPLSQDPMLQTFEPNEIERALELAHLLILIGGGDESRELAFQALRRNILILPLPRTSDDKDGAAEQVYQEILANWKNYQVGLSREQFESLDAPVERMESTVMAVLESLRKRYGL